MSIMYGPMPALFAFMATLIILGDGPVGIVLGVIAAVTAMVLYWYSPLPDHNGGYMAPKDRGRYWGFSRKD